MFLCLYKLPTKDACYYCLCVYMCATAPAYVLFVLLLLLGSLFLPNAICQGFEAGRFLRGCRHNHEFLL